MQRILLSLIITLISITFSSAREVININRGWEFTPDWEVQRGISKNVNLPHTWNLDALSGKADYARSMGSYVKYITVPRTWKDNKVFIRFKGSNLSTTLYVNGKNVGTHKGGYTAFTWDITPYVRLGEKNTLWVRVSNALDLDVMPLVGDFNMYGGIYRDVDIIVTPKTHISLENFGSSGLFVTPSNVSDEKADVKIETTVIGAVNSEADVKFSIINHMSEVIDSVVRSVKIGASGKTDVDAKFIIKAPYLWYASPNPYLYRAEVTVTNRGAKGAVTTTDSHIENFGLRYFSVDKDNQFSLNGKPFKIQGVTMHQDWAGLGNAINPINHQKNVEMMVDMGVNAVRLVNYPHDSYLLDLLDKAGIIVWSEIPFVGPSGMRNKGFNDSDEFRANGKQQLIEMIRQQYNHPSILFWGLYSELIQNGDDPVPFVRELNELAKDEDPTRLTVAASSQDGDLNFITDLIGFNKYAGWGSGLPQDLDSWGAVLRRDWAKLLVGVSEYGAGGSIYQQVESLEKIDVNGNWHPEQVQTGMHEQLWKIISSKPYFWGTFVSTMFDYGAAHRGDGHTSGINDKGLVTFDRAVAKDAYYFYKANWNKRDPFVYIADRRLVNRTKTNQTIKVYSNQPQVELLVDGIIHPAKAADGTGVFVWENVPLALGTHTIEAIGAVTKSDKVTFTIVKPQISLTPQN